MTAPLAVYPLRAWVRLSDTITSIDAVSSGNPTGLVDDPSLVLHLDKEGAQSQIAYGSLVRDSLGAYHYDLQVDVPGRWTFEFVASGAGKGAGEQSFWVDASVFP